MQVQMKIILGARMCDRPIMQVKEGKPMTIKVQLVVKRLIMLSVLLGRFEF